jgi:SAM-dependent methyltransferase
MDFDEAYFVSRKNDMSQRNLMHRNDAIFVSKFFENSNHLKILDIGCADGDFTRMLGEVGTLFGTELNEDEAAKASNIGVRIVRKPEEVSADILILRGTIQHLKIEEFSELLQLRTRYVFLLQSPNLKSIPYSVLNHERVHLLKPNENFSSMHNNMNLREIRDMFKMNGYAVRCLEYPYFRTPYFRPVFDLKELTMSLISKNRTYKGSFPGNIYRLFAERNE